MMVGVVVRAVIDVNFLVAETSILDGSAIVWSVIFGGILVNSGV